MAITDLPLFSMLRTRMQWHQERQRLLAENVSNSDTQGYRPRDLAPLQFDRTMPTLAAIGLDRSKVYIANIVPWRPPGNRTPTPVETQICLPFIQRQIELSNPDVLVTVGQPSTGALLGIQGIMKNRGRWFPYQTGTREIRAMPMLHPAYLLRSPIGKRLAWRDMLAIKKALG